MSDKTMSKYPVVISGCPSLSVVQNDELIAPKLPLFSTPPTNKLSSSIKWADDFPENCPPAKAINRGLEAYRLLKKRSPEETDFKTHKELNIPFKKTNECLACGLSVYTDIDAIYSMLKKVPKMRKKFKFYAKGIVPTDAGVLLETPEKSRHYTWWVYPETNPMDAFSISKISPL